MNLRNRWMTAVTGDRAFWQGGLGSMLVKAISIVLALIVTIVLARALGPGGFGIYAYVFALVSLLAIPAAFGLPALVVREIAKARSLERPGNIKAIWRWSVWAGLALSVVVVLISALVAWTFSGEITERQMTTFLWGLMLVPLLAMVRLVGAGLRGLDHVIEGQVPDLILRSGFFVVLLLAVVWLWPGFDLTAGNAMALHVLGGAIALAVAVIGLHRARGSAPPPLETASYQHRVWLTSLVPLGLSMNVLIINNQAGIVLLGFFANASEVGIYRTAVQGAMLVSFGLTAMTMAAAPSIARLHANGKKSELQRMVTMSTRLSLAIAVPVAIVFGFWGEALLSLAFGEAFGVGYMALLILIIGHLVNASVGTVSLLLDMTGHERETLRGLAIGAGANVVLGLLLIPPFGMEGAAAATAISRVVWSLLLRAAVKRHLDVETLAFAPGAGEPLRQST